VLKQQPHSLLDPLGSAASLGFGPNIEESTFSIFGGAPIVDDSTTVTKTILSLSAFPSILLPLSYIQSQKINSYEYVVPTMFSTLSMLLIASSYDLISMYPATESQSSSPYVSAAFQRNNESPTEAGLKYFVLGALSSGLSPSGESIIHGFTGITNSEESTKSRLLWVPPVVPTTTLLQLDGSSGATTGMGEITS
jgi:NADH-quinone oxidoreductase subunit N